MKQTKFLAIWIFAIFFTTPCYPQYQLGLNLDAVIGINPREINLTDLSVEQHRSLGLNFALTNRWTLKKSKFHVLNKIGGRYLFSSGWFSNGQFKISTYKGVLSLGAGYSINEKIGTSLCYEIENNVDSDELIGLKDNILRHSLTFQFDYQLTKNLFGSILFYRAITPIQDVYLIGNPINQVRIGLHYQIL